MGRRTASGPSHCSTTVSDCAAVYKYLDAQSRNMAGYVGSPIWSVVDGPWKLTAFNADGNVTMVPNPSYSGSDKAHLSEFQELPFTTDAAEYDVLRSPSSSSKIDVGYIPTEDLPAKPLSAATGSNPLPGYTLGSWNSWGISYYTVNEQSTISDHAAIFKQLYIRQALAYLMNGQAVLEGPLKGYGSLTTGPVASEPVTPWLSSQGGKNAFPYNPTQAKSLLTSHGWTVNSGGATTCSNASLCGSGISVGTPLSFTFAYASGLAWVQCGTDPAAVERGGAGHQAEPQARAVQHGGRGVRGQLRGGQDPVQLGHGRLGSGLVVLPGRAADRGDAVPVRCDRQLRRVLRQDQRLADRDRRCPAAATPRMYNWQDYLQTQLPVEWQPNAPYQVTEVVSNLHGVLPQPSTLMLDPENWYYVKS